MASTLDPGIQAHLDTREIETQYLFEIGFPSGTVYLCTGKRNQTFDGTEYLAYDIKFSPYNRTASDQVDVIEVNASTLDGTFTSLLLSEGFVGKPLKIYAVFYSYGYGYGPYGAVPYGEGAFPRPIADPVEIFSGIMDSAKIGGGRALVSVSSVLILWHRKAAKRQFAQTCPWVFKGNQCAYGGVGTRGCDKSWNTCKYYNNQIQFGGFKFMSEMQTKELWWGSTVTPGVTG